MAILDIYIAASFRHMHGAQLLASSLTAFDCAILDWTIKATPPPGLTPAQRREWMDTDQEGGAVYTFCRDACLNADLLIYYGASGQDAGVEVGLAAGAGTPILGIRGPLEAPGLMLHGAVNVWVDSAPEAVRVVAELAQLAKNNFTAQARLGPVRALAPLIQMRGNGKFAQLSVDATHFAS